MTQDSLDEADEIAQEAGVDEKIASAPGTMDEVKAPAKRDKRASMEPVEKTTPREVFDYVIEQGRKEYQVQRYKGLGEMTAPQLWGNDDGPGTSDADAGEAGGYCGDRRDLYYADGRGC